MFFFLVIVLCRKKWRAQLIITTRMRAREPTRKARKWAWLVNRQVSREEMAWRSRAIKEV